MADIKTVTQDQAGVQRSADHDVGGASEADRAHERTTSGKNRDFDESGQSTNQAHGHPRGERDQVSQ